MNDITHYKIKQRVIYVENGVKYHATVESLDFKHSKVILKTINGNKRISMDKVFVFNLGKTLKRIRKLENKISV